jgi:hypothetical protein
MGFDEQAAVDWESGRLQQALQRMWALATRPDADLGCVLQAMYYMYCAGTFRPAQDIARAALPRFPNDLDLLLNAGVIDLRLDDHDAARQLFERYLGLGGTEETALDGLATACHGLGDDAAARRWGEQAIVAKTERAERTFPPIALGAPRGEGADVIAFSLWGAEPRYLRGALLNVVRARSFYPGFVCRFMVDPSVPVDLLRALEGEGAELAHDPTAPDLRRRLTRRFTVADDPAVRRYLVRDADSVVNARDAAAVGEWMADGRPFHVMRDWWTHTDPILAGMWGGIGGVLPPLAPLIADYRPDHAETGHVDQWFLRDCVWPSIRAVSMVHDRCYRLDGSRPFPTPDPPDEDHVGQNEHGVVAERTAEDLVPFARTVPSLRL